MGFTHAYMACNHLLTPICDSAMTTDEIECSSCDVNKTVASTPLTREALYALVWSEPMLMSGKKGGNNG